MHGRQKVERSPEDEAAKQAERGRKVAAYKFAMSNIFQKRAEKDLEQELLGLTGKVLAANPDIWTLWNIRREILLSMKEKNQEEFRDLVQGELDVTEVGLRQNPKSYGAWYHRHWLMTQTNFELVDSEMKLCAKFLKYDDRNFHCWDYRKFLVDHNPKITVEEEIAFTTEKIRNNFSNYSSWHLRSKLLPRLTPSILEAELDLIQNAAFTDPNDQSVWFYHKWLVNTNLQNVSPVLNHIRHVGDELYLVFNSDVLNPATLGLTANVILKNGKSLESDCVWSNPWKKPKCKVWMTKLLNQDVEAISFRNPGFKIPESVIVDEVAGAFTLSPNKTASVQNFTEEEVPDFSSFLAKELAWVEELHELEPENKWAILTMIHLLRLVDFNSNEDKIWSEIEKLKVLDSKRGQYYQDLSANMKLERDVLRKLEISPRLCSYILPPF